MTETPTEYQTSPPEAQPEKRDTPRELSMQRELSRLIERHGYSTVLDELIHLTDLLGYSQLTIALEKARDISEGLADE